MASPPRKFRPTIGEKLYILQEAEAPNRSLKSVARQFGVQPVQIWNWRKQQDILIQSSRKKKGLNPGRPSRIQHLEGPLLRWIEEQRNLNLPLNYMQIVVKACHLDNDFSRKSFESKYHMIRRMCKKNRIVIRVRTHVSQQRPDEVIEVAYNWLFYI